MTRTHVVALALLLGAIPALEGCNEAEGESIDFTSFRYSCEIDYMQRPGSGSNSDYLIPRIELSPLHDIGIDVKDTASDWPDVAYDPEFEWDDVWNPAIPASCRDTCPDGRYRHSFQLIGVDTTEIAYRHWMGVTPGGYSWSYVFVGNLQKTFEEEDLLTVALWRTSLHELIHQMGVGGDCWEYSSCVRYHAFLTRMMEGDLSDLIFSLCGTCASKVRAERDEGNWMLKVDCSGNLFSKAEAWYRRTLAGLAWSTAVAQSSCEASTSDVLLLPREQNGLRLEISAVGDTLLVGEPVIVEVLLRNVGDSEILETCFLNPAGGLLRFYAILSDSSVVGLDPWLTGSWHDVEHILLPPKSYVGTAISIGSRFMIGEPLGRAPGELDGSIFEPPGSYRVFATYVVRDSKKGCSGSVTSDPVRLLKSNAVSFNVVEPHGQDAMVYGALKDSSLRLSASAALGDLRELANSSSYSQFIDALYAKSLVMAHESKTKRYGEAIKILRRLVNENQDSRLAQEWEFDIATLLCRMGKEAEAKDELNDLLVRYPHNVRAYETCAESGRGLVLRKNAAVTTDGGD